MVNLATMGTTTLPIHTSELDVDSSFRMSTSSNTQPASSITTTDVFPSLLFDYTIVEMY